MTPKAIELIKKVAEYPESIHIQHRTHANINGVQCFCWLGAFAREYAKTLGLDNIADVTYTARSFMLPTNDIITLNDRNGWTFKQISDYLLAGEKQCNEQK